MPLRLTSLLVVAALAAPLPAAAGQALAPAAVVASAPKMASLVSPAARQNPEMLRPARLRPEALRPTPRLLPLPSGFEQAAGSDKETPEFELRARAEWFEDEGLTISPTKIAYRQRF